MIINGEIVKSKKTVDVINPFTRKKVGSVAIATKKDVDNALRLAYEAKPKLDAQARANILRRVSKTLKENKEEYALTITSESGLSLKDTIYEVERVANCAHFASLVALDIDKDITPEFILDEQAGAPTLNVITEPLDLVAAITPFNHPMNQVAHKVFPAIAAGTCMVLKPSEKTPLSALKLGELLLKEGLEPNMLNIVTGQSGKDVAQVMINDPRVDMVTFTGGLKTGLAIKKEMAKGENALKKYIPELGGSSSLIVADDADIGLAVSLTLNGCFKNSGQRCTSVRRVVVVSKVANQFIKQLVEAAQKISYGDPFNPNTDMGTVISAQAAKIIEERVQKAIKDGAKLKLGHKRKGALYAPTILDHVSLDSELISMETFGPVCPVLRVRNLDEAIKTANTTKYRLAGAVVTASQKTAQTVCDALRVGQFSWNGVPGYRTEAAPFGGFGDSGNGEKEGVVLAARAMRRIRTFYTHV